jgi:hypothetical protein
MPKCIFWLLVRTGQAILSTLYRKEDVMQQDDRTEHRKHPRTGTMDLWPQWRRDILACIRPIGHPQGPDDLRGPIGTILLIEGDA